MKSDKLKSVITSIQNERARYDTLIARRDEIEVQAQTRKDRIAELLDGDTEVKRRLNLDSEKSINSLLKARDRINKEIVDERSKLRADDKEYSRVEKELEKSEVRMQGLEAKYTAARAEVHDWVEQIDADFQKETGRAPETGIISRFLGRGSIGAQAGKSPEGKKRPMQRLKRALAFKVAPQIALFAGALLLVDDFSGVHALSSPSNDQASATEYLNSMDGIGPNTRELLALSGIEAIRTDGGSYIFASTDLEGDLPGVDAVSLERIISKISKLDGMDETDAKEIFEHHIAPTVQAAVQQCRVARNCSDGSQSEVIADFQYEDEYGNEVKLSWSNQDGLGFRDNAVMAQNADRLYSDVAHLGN